MGDECFRCGSKKIVSSVVRIDPYRELGWVYKNCYDELHAEDPFEQKYMYGHEGFVEEEKTVWDSQTEL